MQDKAFIVLEAIRRGALADCADHDRWLKAFHTVQWTCETAEGVTLTAAGHNALSEMSRAKRSDAPTAH